MAIADLTQTLYIAPDPLRWKGATRCNFLFNSPTIVIGGVTDRVGGNFGGGISGGSLIFVIKEIQYPCGLQPLVWVPSTRQGKNEAVVSH